MGNRLFLSLSYHNIPSKVKKPLVLALINETLKTQMPQIVLINTEPGGEFETSPGKLTKDHPWHRYSSTLNGLDIPFLDRDAFLYLCNEMGRLKNQSLFDQSVTVVLQSKPPTGLSVTAFDALCIITPPEHAVVPLLYQSITSMRSYSKNIPVFLWIFGESRIESGAEFFLQIKNELEQFVKDDLELVYIGSIQIPKEELLLLLRFNLTIHTAFPQSSILGAVRYASQRLFTFPEIPPGSLSAEVLQGLLQE